MPVSKPKFAKLSLPKADNLRLRTNSVGVVQIWDNLRKIWLPATPEEWVRQNFIHYLCNTLGYNGLHIHQEYPVAVGKLNQRADIVVCSSDGTPMMLVECKASDVTISSKTLDQAARYNMTIQAQYILLTNGLQHFAYKIDIETGEMSPLAQIPKSSDIDF